MAKIYIDNAKYMEFIDDIATQITEERFGDEMYENKDGTDLSQKSYLYYNEKYDEIETMLNETLNIYNYESKRNGKLSS